MSETNFDELFECERTISQLENEIRSKMKVLSERQSLKRAAVVDNKWLTQSRKALPNVLVEKIDEVNQNLVNKESDYLQIDNIVKKILEQQVETVVHLKKDVAKQKFEVKKLQQQLLYLDNKKLLESESEDESVDNIQELSETSAKVFAKMKKYLHFVLQNFYESDMEELIKDLTNAYFKGGDEQYIDLDPKLATCAVQLIEAGLVLKHPIEKHRIKFDKFY